MIGTILLAAGLALIGSLTATHLLVQRKLQTLDEQAFKVWFSRAFFGITVEATERERELGARATKKLNAKTRRRTPGSRPEEFDRVDVESPQAP